MLNADLLEAVRVQTSLMQWQSSPSATVRRKRFHLVGAPESGQVTSLVEYLPGASFHRHEHPEGEEILVLDGVFSDDNGDWPAGTWLLNPEGFAHAPFSKNGCLLFVKLRQYPGAEHLNVEWASLPNLARANAKTTVPAKDGANAVYYRTLLKQSDESIVIVSLGDGSIGGRLKQHYGGGVEGFVISGSAKLNGEPITRHDWFRLPPGAEIDLASDDCTLYLKENNVSKLRNLN